MPGGPPLPSLEAPPGRSAGLDRLTDEQLARLLKSGHTAAFDELYRRYAGRLTIYGGRLLGDRSAGEDVAQTSLLSALQALRRGAEPRRVQPWLYRAARNAALEMLGRRWELADANGHAAGHGDDAHTARGALLAALDTLCERQRRVYLLREVRGLSISEIAAELEMATEQVEQALFAARNRLAEVLVFGKRLDCEAVERLHGTRLGRTERRALKAHLRSCAPCRASAPARSALTLLPIQLFETVRHYVAGLLGASAPTAKVGAAVVTGALALGAQVAATTERTREARTAAQVQASVERDAAANPAMPPWSVDPKNAGWGAFVPAFLAPTPAPKPTTTTGLVAAPAPTHEEVVVAQEEEAPADEELVEAPSEEAGAEEDVVEEVPADPPVEPDPAPPPDSDPLPDPAPDPEATDPGAADPGAAPADPGSDSAEALPE